MTMNRRTFLKAGATALLALVIPGGRRLLAEPVDGARRVTKVFLPLVSSGDAVMGVTGTGDFEQQFVFDGVSGLVFT